MNNSSSRSPRPFEPVMLLASAFGALTRLYGRMVKLSEVAIRCRYASPWLGRDA